MLIIGILDLVVLIFIALVAACSLDLLTKIAVDVSSIHDYQSKEHAKFIAEIMKKRGYVLTEAGKEFVKVNADRD